MMNTETPGSLLSAFYAGNNYFLSNSAISTKRINSAR